tara:strand:- start:146 stop:400 length:255 start_codon:yes stop_codon:yes gene_type:complete
MTFYGDIALVAIMRFLMMGCHVLIYLDNKAAMREYDAEWRGGLAATGLFQAKRSSCLGNVKMLCLCHDHHHALKTNMVRISKAF